MPGEERVVVEKPLLIFLVLLWGGIEY